MFPPSLLVCPRLEQCPCRPDCGRRTRLQIIPPSSLVFSSGMGADWSSSACVQRGESSTARCASTEDHQAPSLPTFREQKADTGTVPSSLSCGLGEQGEWSGCSPSPLHQANSASKEEERLETVCEPGTPGPH